jgi:predicted anti-sigma-YlaC factor YlaD
MTCQEYQALLTGYIDDELPDEERRRLDHHLHVCQACSQELKELLAIKEHLSMIKIKEPSDAELERYWSRVYNRLERGVGWILFSLGSIILLCYGAFKLIEEVVRDPGLSLVLKIGVVSLIFGGVVLFVSLLRERLSVRKTDKYSREVEK